MKRRTTIEIDDDLLTRARRALGNQTTRATVEEALRRVAEAADDDRGDRAARQLSHLQRLSSHADVAVLTSEEMWRMPACPTSGSMISATRSPHCI
ncbi:MAG: type II toxin-antitoxin system VapB family antitoxin [Chloroflexota bacterium]